MVVGQDPFDVERIWQYLFALTYTCVRDIPALARQRRQLVTATGAIRIFDLTGSYVIAFEPLIGDICGRRNRRLHVSVLRDMKIAPAVASA